MGSFVQFRYNGGASVAHSLLADGDPAFVVDLGAASFSGFTASRQRSVYGLDWQDCLSCGPEGDEEEWGPPGDHGPNEWYTPDWLRAVTRVERLWAAVQAGSSPRREYDMARLPAFREAILRCANHRDPANCQVRFDV